MFFPNRYGDPNTASVIPPRHSHLSHSRKDKFLSVVFRSVNTQGPTVTLSLIRFSFQRVPGARRLASKNRLLSRSQEAGKKMSKQIADRPLLSWPCVLREVRAWLEPWVMLQCYWRAWSTQPPPLLLQQLLEALCLGVPLFLYNSS